MVYDVVVTVKIKERSEKNEPNQRTFSLRVEAINAAYAKLEMSKHLSSLGVLDHPRFGFSIREAK